MSNKKLLLYSVFLLSTISGFAQNKNAWNGKKCAVSLTYDDALNIDLDKVIPVLDSVKLKGTFYLIASSKAFTNRLKEWKVAASHGHEIANHSLFHPCASGPGRNFVTAEYDLKTYSIKRINDEMRMANAVFEALDGKKKRTYAYPCGDTKINDSSYIDPSKTEFVAARGTKPEMQTIDKIDIYNVGSYMINGETGQQLIDLVKKAMETNTYLVFLFHGVGGEHSLNVSTEAHSQLLHYLKQHEKEIWVAPFINVMEHVKKHQASSGAAGK
jgi:peptidoglycan/xylan/chitin deacetylase (PgdA/CDA1 family)